MLALAAVAKETPQSSLTCNLCQALMVCAAPPLPTPCSTPRRLPKVHMGPSPGDRKPTNLYVQMYFFLFNDLLGAAENTEDPRMHCIISPWSRSKALVELDTLGCRMLFVTALWRSLQLTRRCPATRYQGSNTCTFSHSVFLKVPGTGGCQQAVW